MLGLEFLAARSRLFQNGMGLGPVKASKASPRPTSRRREHVRRQRVRTPTRGRDSRVHSDLYSPHTLRGQRFDSRGALPDIAVRVSPRPSLSAGRSGFPSCPVRCQHIPWLAPFSCALSASLGGAVYATTLSWGSAASSHLSSILLVADESAAAAAQDGRAAGPARSVLHLTARGKLLDRGPLSPDSWVDRATRVASDVIEPRLKTESGVRGRWWECPRDGAFTSERTSAEAG
jgi:hypothetical protein